MKQEIFSMNGAAQNVLNEKRIFPEILTAIERAGGNYIISYYAKELIINGLQNQ